MHVHPYGQRALIADVHDHHQALALYEDLRRDPVEGLVDVVPAACTVLVVFVDQVSATRARAALLARTPAPHSASSPAAPVTIPVVYDGPDLASVAELTALPVEAVIAAHQAGDYTVAFLGFAPGFGYLSGLDRRLHLPRRASPRTHVAGGSVAVAGDFTAVYPAASPGGWHLIGHTPTAMFDLHREPPALLSPGSRVRFERVMS